MNSGTETEVPTNPASESPELCSKCSGPLDIAAEPGTAKWCKGCRAKYQKEYQALGKRREFNKGFAAAAGAWRDYLALNWEKYHVQRFSGPEIAKVCKELPGPALPAE